MQKAVAIFGATSSIGSSVAGRFLADGFVVHATGRNQQKLAELTKSAGRSVIHSHTLDILDDASIQSTAQNIRRSCSQLDHRLTSLVYCVGVRRDQLLMRSSDHDLQLTLDSNLLGALRVCKHMAKVMIGKGGTSSSIVLIGQ